MSRENVNLKLLESVNIQVGISQILNFGLEKRVYNSNDSLALNGAEYG